MKMFVKTCRHYLPFLICLLVLDGFFSLLLWISDAESLWRLTGLILLASLIFFAAIIFVMYLRETQKQALFQEFLTEPDEINTEKLLRVVSASEREQLQILGTILEENQERMQQMEDSLRDYEEYVEGWAHEAKTPLSLLTMLLDNRGDEFSLSLQMKLDYVRSQLQEDVTQILYYARLGSSTKDYRFEAVDLEDADIFTISDHGTGVKSYDLPYIFQKGFTGDATDSRKKATGMGLYLTKRMADDLNLKLEAESQWGEGMQMRILFPKVSLDADERK